MTSSSSWSIQTLRERGPLGDLLSHINTSVNEGENGKNLLVLHADVKNPAEVATRILDPILSHLARRLPEMDAMVQQESNRAFSAAQSAVAEWTRVSTSLHGSTLEVRSPTPRNVRTNFVAI